MTNILAKIKVGAQYLENLKTNFESFKFRVKVGSDSACQDVRYIQDRYKDSQLRTKRALRVNRQIVSDGSMHLLTRIIYGFCFITWRSHNSVAFESCTS